MMEYLTVLGMWSAMTALMMAPVAVPWVLALRRIGVPADRSVPSTLPFVVGYAVAWAGFSAAVALLHTGLFSLGVPVPFGLEARGVSAAVLIFCGAFQFTGLKTACLRLCRSPAGFFLAHWRDGIRGHVEMGIRHGLHCVGCCWALMLLALVVGMANLVWMGLLMAIMFTETALPFGSRLTKPVGAGLVVAGVLVLVG